MADKANASESIADNVVGENAIDDTVVTMVEVLEHEHAMEEEYTAVLGASDEKCCNYAIGAVKRQALYSCLTCCPEARTDLTKCAGICLACSYRCHEHHELVELYTKRNFRCDCPTARFAKSCCVLNGGQDTLPRPVNANNKYNQNFQALYCICKRPYPDPESTSEEVMLQCIVCEDWYHVQHLDVPMPAAQKLADTCTEVVCASCMQQNKFLQDYTGLALKTLEPLDDSTANITVCGDTSISEEKDVAESDTVASGSQQKVAVENLDYEPSCKKFKDANEEEKTNAGDKLIGCCRPLGKGCYDKGATFWGNDWRAALCKCLKCLDMYSTLNVEFLVDAEDTVKSYEQRGNERDGTETSAYEQGIQALASMGHTTQIEAITEYNNMMEQLKEYLKSFATANKVVTKEDITSFFEKMRENKKQVGLQHFCR